MPSIAETAQRPGAIVELSEPLEMALQFVALCNNHTKPILMEDSEYVRIVEPELPLMQEKVFNLACAYLGEYFARQAKQSS